MKLREVLEDVNKRLQAIFDKPVMDNGTYGNKYDTTNGREVVSEYAIRGMLSEYLPNSYIRCDKGREFIWCAIMMIGKKKKSGMISSSYTDRMTIVKLELSEYDEKYLDIEIDDIISAYNERKANDDVKIENEREQKKTDFYKKLVECNIAPSKFLELSNMFDSLEWNSKREIERASK